MISGGSMKSYVEKTVNLYSSLFSLPSTFSRVFFLHLLVNGVGGIAAFLPLKLTTDNFSSGLLLGFAFLSIILLTDLLIHYSLLKTDPIFSLRRCGSLSLVSSMLWFAFIFLGAILSSFLGNPNLWVKLYLLGFCSRRMPQN